MTHGALGDPQFAGGPRDILMAKRLSATKTRLRSRRLFMCGHIMNRSDSHDESDELDEWTGPDHLERHMQITFVRWVLVLLAATSACITKEKRR